jgi:hypothetical protein
LIFKCFDRNLRIFSLLNDTKYSLISICS